MSLKTYIVCVVTKFIIVKPKRKTKKKTQFFFFWGTGRKIKKNIYKKNFCFVSIKNMKSFWREIDHAFHPVFQHKIDHCPKKCKKCYEKSMKKAEHIASHVPLDYQDTKFSTDVKRFSFGVYTKPEKKKKKQEWDLWLEMVEGDFKCDMTRILDFRPGHVPPTKAGLTGELKTLGESLRANSHVFLYAEGGLTALGEDLTALDFSLLLGTFSSHVTFWGLFNFPFAENFLSQVGCRYRYTPAGGQEQEAEVPSGQALANLFFFCFVEVGRQNVDNKENMLFQKWTAAMLQNHCRISLFDLMKSVSGEGFELVLYSSRRLTNLKKIYYGF